MIVTLSTIIRRLRLISSNLYEDRLQYFLNEEKRTNNKTAIYIENIWTSKSHPGWRPTKKAEMEDAKSNKNNTFEMECFPLSTMINNRLRTR